MGKKSKQWHFIFLGSKITADSDCSHENKRHLLLRRKVMTPRQCIKKQRHYFVNKGLYSQSYGFSNSQVWMWELDYKESWALKNWCFWTVVLVKTLESPLDSKEIKPVNPKGNQHWIFIGRSDVEPLILWPPDAKNWLIGEGNGNPLQCSCLENPRDSGAWWAAISGVAQSRIRLKRLSSSSSRQHIKKQTLLCQQRSF